MKYDYLMKIIFVGGPCVGKTSMLSTYCNKHYDSKYMPTIGVDFHATYHRVDEKTIKCHMWDTAGQEQFKCIINSYYKGIAAAVCLFDVSRPETFNEAKSWIDTVKHSSSTEHLPILLIANKIDLDHSAFVVSEARIYCNENGYDFIETSVKKNLRIEDAMEAVVQKIYKEIIVPGIPSPGVKINSEEKEQLIKSVNPPVQPLKCCTIS